MAWADLAMKLSGGLSEFACCNCVARPEVPTSRQRIQNPADALSLKRKLSEEIGHGREPISISSLPSLSLGQPACRRHAEKETLMRGIILWLLGVPVVVIILLYVFHVL